MDGHGRLRTDGLPERWRDSGWIADWRLNDDELAFSILSIFNDSCADRQEESGNRLFPLPNLPLWDKAEWEKEARRCIDMGLKGFVLPDKARAHRHSQTSRMITGTRFGKCAKQPARRSRSISTRQSTRVAMTWEAFNFEQRLAVASMMFSVGNAATLGNWIVSGVLDRYPKLKIGLIESGLGWIPFVLEMMEHQIDEMMPVTGKKLQRRPWEYFHENFWATFWYESIAPKHYLDMLGADRVLFETDYPHPTSLYPECRSISSMYSAGTISR